MSKEAPTFVPFEPFHYSDEQEELASHLYTIRRDRNELGSLYNELGEPYRVAYHNPDGSGGEVLVDEQFLKTLRYAEFAVYTDLAYRKVEDDDNKRVSRIIDEEGIVFAQEMLKRADEVGIFGK